MDLRDIKAKLNLWMKYALRIDVRWLYLTKRGKKNELLLIQGMRFLSILFNSTQMAIGIDSCNGTRFCIRWKIEILINLASSHGIEHQSFTL